MAGNWIEATTVYPDGLRHVDMEGFDAEAFEAVLYVIHGKNSKVIRKVQVDMLCKVAVVVDDLQCREAVEAVAWYWISPHTTRQCLLYGRALVLWIFISSVFRLRNTFRELTRTAIVGTEGPLPTLGLPMRDKIISKCLDHKVLAACPDLRPRPNRRGETTLDWPCQGSASRRDEETSVRQGQPHLGPNCNDS